MFLANGTLLQGGKYKIVRHISSGGFGNTYEALDVNLDKRVAIKEFFVKDFCSRESDTTLVTIASTAKKPLIEHLKKKFIEEARAIAKMEHDNIVKVQALFEENGTAYYVMDYIDGESLSDLLKRHGSLPENEAVAIILKVADALGYMHKQNRFHLDVKPANIMLRNDGKVILIDFGSSKQYAEVDSENTTTLAPCYTTGYAPAEQMNPKPTAFTAATDVYALGATLYKTLTGMTPTSAIDLLNGETVLPQLPDEISKNVRECVEKAMRPQRKERIQGIDEFVAMLNSKKTAPVIETKPVISGVKAAEQGHVDAQKNLDKPLMVAKAKELVPWTWGRKAVKCEGAWSWLLWFFLWLYVGSLKLMIGGDSSLFVAGRVVFVLSVIFLFLFICSLLEYRKRAKKYKVEHPDDPLNDYLSIPGEKNNNIYSYTLYCSNNYYRNRLLF